MTNTADIATADQSALGRKSQSDMNYNPDRLFPIPREGKRAEIGIDESALPFHGFDCWNHYEVSWLNNKGKPMVAITQIIYDCTSPCIIESKSMKLYFNSFNNTKFDSVDAVKQAIARDISSRIQSDVQAILTELSQLQQPNITAAFTGESIDHLDVECHDYLIMPDYLNTDEEQAEEALHSDLLKSNCLVTEQPDWGSVLIEYKGNKIDREGLLKYIVSFRNHNEFHEQCIERIFVDIMKYCKPEKLTVYGRYTRRGGIDINPYRSTQQTSIENKNLRLIRQ